MAGAAIIELIGVQRQPRSDVATGVVLGAALGAAALFLYLGTQTSSTTGASFTILFGSMFVISPDTVPALIASGVLALAVVAVLSRVLLLTSLSPELATARSRAGARGHRIPRRARRGGVAVRGSHRRGARRPALLIGPAATALRVAKSPGRAMAAAALIGTAITWLGILLAYDSYYWPPHGHGWPVSFFVVALVVVAYLLSYAWRPRRNHRERAAAAAADPREPACSPA